MTTTPLERPIPAGQDLRAVVTTEFTQWVGGWLLYHAVRVSTITHDVGFRVGVLRPGMVGDHTRAWFLRNGGRPMGACMNSKPGPVDRVAHLAMYILALLSVLSIPMALVEGRRYRRDHPPPPPPAAWGPLEASRSKAGSART